MATQKKSAQKSLNGSVSLLYVTFPSLELAQDISKDLLSKRLIACANIFPVMQSFYWWEEDLESSAESVAILKLPSAKLSSCIKALKALHPYKAPCFIEIKPKSVNPEYLSWLLTSVSLGSSRTEARK